MHSLLPVSDRWPAKCLTGMPSSENKWLPEVAGGIASLCRLGTKCRDDLVREGQCRADTPTVWRPSPHASDAKTRMPSASSPQFGPVGLYPLQARIANIVLSNAMPFAAAKPARLQGPLKQLPASGRSGSRPEKTHNSNAVRKAWAAAWSLLPRRLHSIYRRSPTRKAAANNVAQTFGRGVGHVWRLACSSAPHLQRLTDAGCPVTHTFQLMYIIISEMALQNQSSFAGGKQHKWPVALT